MDWLIAKLPPVVIAMIVSAFFTLWANDHFSTSKEADVVEKRVSTLEEKQEADRELLIKMDTKLDLILKHQIR